MEQSVPTILPPRVQIPSTPSKLFSIYTAQIIYLSRYQTEIFHYITTYYQHSFCHLIVCKDSIKHRQFTAYLSIHQCDQMAKLFFQSWAIYKQRKFAQQHKNCQSRLKHLAKTSKSCQKLLKSCPSGKILPNLVTLLPTYISIIVMCSGSSSNTCYALERSEAVGMPWARAAASARDVGG